MPAMSDKPATMRLNPAEWRDLLITNLERLRQWIAQFHEPPPPDEFQALREFNDRIRLQMAAWAISNRPAVSAPVPAAAPPPNGNGHGAPKRKGGWPKGKPRKPRQPQQMAQ